MCCLSYWTILKKCYCCGRFIFKDEMVPQSRFEEMEEKDYMDYIDILGLIDCHGSPLMFTDGVPNVCFKCLEIARTQIVDKRDICSLCKLSAHCQRHLDHECREVIDFWNKYTP